MRGDGGVAGEGRIVGVPKFHSWGKYTMPLTNIRLDVQRFFWLVYYIKLYYMDLLIRILGCNEEWNIYGSVADMIPYRMGVHDSQEVQYFLEKFSICQTSCDTDLFRLA